MPKHSAAHSTARATARTGTAVGADGADTKAGTSQEETEATKVRASKSGSSLLSPAPKSGLVRPGSRATDVIAFDDAVVSFFVDAAAMLGVPKSVAAIYGICFASPDPLSFSEINERLDISSGSISQGLRVLRDVGALRVAQHEMPKQRNTESPKLDRATTSTDNIGIDAVISRDSRTARYEPDLELRNLVLHWLEKRLEGQLSSGRSRLQQIIASIPQASKGHPANDTLQTRFESLQTWQDKAHSLLPIAKTFLKLT